MLVLVLYRHLLVQYLYNNRRVEVTHRTVPFGDRVDGDRQLVLGQTCRTIRPAALAPVSAEEAHHVERPQVGQICRRRTLNLSDDGSQLEDVLLVLGKEGLTRLVAGEDEALLDELESWQGKRVVEVVSELAGDVEAELDHDR